MIKYLSPSSISCYREDPEEFFLRYMVRVPRQPQSQAMAAGSAFDACCKAWILVNHCDRGAWPVQLGGGNVNEKRVPELIEWDSSVSDHMNVYNVLFHDSVEEHNREWAWDVGKIIFVDYRACGALDGLLRDATEVRPIDALQASIRGVPLLGKPDLVMRMNDEWIVDDWKCNGYVAKRTVSPTPGFIDIWPSREMHPKCRLNDTSDGSLPYNLERVPEQYRIQLVIYSLLVNGEPQEPKAPVNPMVGINQLVFNKDSVLRVAVHRYRISNEMVDDVMNEAAELWDVVNRYAIDGGSFGPLSADRCSQLIAQGKVFTDPLMAAMTGRG